VKNNRALLGLCPLANKGSFLALFWQHGHNWTTCLVRPNGVFMVDVWWWGGALFLIKKWLAGATD
jgi:hypothetical protein